MPTTDDSISHKKVGGAKGHLSGTGDSSGISLVVPDKMEGTAEGGEAPPGGPSSPVWVFTFKNGGSFCI